MVAMFMVNIRFRPTTEFAKGDATAKKKSRYHSVTCMLPTPRLLKAKKDHPYSEMQRKSEKEEKYNKKNELK